MNRTWTSMAAAVLLAAIAAGCGADERGTPTPTPVPASRIEIPSELAGTWTTTLKRSELADPPDDLTEARSVWTLKLLGTGGKNNGPSMFLANDELGEFVNPVSLTGRFVRLQTPGECVVFGYLVEHGRLRLKAAERGCPSTAISSVLTGRPWRRAAG